MNSKKPLRGLVKRFSIENLFKDIILTLIAFYRLNISLFLGGSCRFYPSCSEYAQDCFKNHKFRKASYFVLNRILKCHPFGKYGYDPVPCSNNKKKDK